jgi:hypothetical protein
MDHRNAFACRCKVLEHLVVDTMRPGDVMMATQCCEEFVHIKHSIIWLSEPTKKFRGYVSALSLNT